MKFLAILLLIIGLYYAIAKPYIFVLYFGLFGSNIGARGFTGFFDLYFQYYSLTMQCLIVIALIVSLFHFHRTKNHNFIKKWVRISLALLITMMTSLIMFFLFYDVDGSLMARFVLAISSYGPAVFIIWLSYASEFAKHKKALLCYSFIQCFIAFGILYGPQIGLEFLNNINAGNYMLNGYYYLNESNDMVAKLSNFWLVFVDGKNTHFIRCGQFHNANGLGFAAGTLFFLFLDRMLFSKGSMQLSKKITSVVGCLFAFLLWCNAGTRGVIIGILFAFVIELLPNITSRRKVKPTSIVLTFGVILGSIVLFAIDSGKTISYLIGSGSASSMASRMQLLEATVNHFWEFFVCGNGGDLDSLFGSGIDPHMIPLRLYCMYGIIPAILSFIILIIMPIKHIVFCRKRSFYSLGAFLIVLFIGMTNNYTEVVLFWTLLAESVLGVLEDSRTSNIVLERSNGNLGSQNTIFED